MRLLILVRHGAHGEVGRVLSGRSEIGLNAAGRAQAEALARVLSGATIRSLHTSPRCRARETLAPLAKRRGLTVRVAVALDEIDFGDFSGRDFATLQHDPEWHRWNGHRGTARCPGGETMAEVSARAGAYIAALAPADFPALCVTHCDVIRGLVAHQLGLGFERLFVFGCEPGSRTTLELSQGSTRLVTLNEQVLP